MPTKENRLLSTAKAAAVHKVIDITPQPEPAARFAFAQRLVAAPGLKMAVGAGCGAVLALAAVVLCWPHAKKTEAAAPAQVARPVAAVAAAHRKALAPLSLNLVTAVDQGVIECAWHGNGKDHLAVTARNLSSQPIRVYMPAGQLLASADSTIVTVQSHLLEMAAHAVFHEEFSTLATSSANKVADAEYHLSFGPQPEVTKLLAYVAAHPSISPGALQTATLILTENLPLSSFAKFNELSGGVALLPDTKDFKAETVDILTALTVIKEIGVTRPLAVTIDPQLRIEGMIDPATHALALHYYGIKDEWAYWKHELLEGDPSTRHYALYGIARFYPEVALQMLPKWARQDSVTPVFRLSAVQALAQTEKTDAIPILRGLENEFGGNTELGRAAHASANYLDEQFARSSRLAAQNAARTGVQHAPALASAVIVPN